MTTTPSPSRRLRPLSLARRRRPSDAARFGLAALAALLLATPGGALASPVAMGALAGDPRPAGTAAVRVQYHVDYRGPYYVAPPPGVRWHFHYRGAGHGPLYDGPGRWVATRPAPPRVHVAPHALPPAGPPAYPPAVAPPPPNVPLASDARETILLPLGSQPRTVVDVVRHPEPFTAAWYEYCAAKYRSFDPASGTFLGYDGRRHPCR